MYLNLDLFYNTYDYFFLLYFYTINFNVSFIFNKCKPFKLTKEDLKFLKSNTRIN